ncbi:MAG: hypothetical protein KAW12_03850 [Candidatus Aminicenantes bacterium]|nr:hypothetical protein [Candidatus Aminicenantes bacterium]
MPENFQSPAKILIRKEWSKKLIEFVKRKLQKKIIYLGLPSPDAKDILEWIDSLDGVIAFQCRDYRHRSAREQSRKAVDTLEKQLDKLIRQKKIETFAVYDGYIEEVILRGRDNSDIDFRQDDVITVYNLDFCNQITSPIKFVDKEGNIEEAFKFDAIHELLKYQRSIKNQSKKFIMFLTIHCGYEGKELENFINHHHDSGISSYHNNIKKLPDKSLKKPRFLKSYMLDSLKEYFKTQGFIPEFLPVIYYQGVGGNKLLHFTIFGTGMPEKTGTASFFQDIPELLKQKFITVLDNKFELLKEGNIEENDVQLNPTEIFSKSKTYKKYWIKK